MGGEWGAIYCECFGTKKQQNEFYKKEFYKYLVTYAMLEEEHGRIMFSVTVPAHLIKTKAVRGALLEAIKQIPRSHRGGASHIVKPYELPQLFDGVQDLIQDGSTLPSAISRVADGWGIDPRTLKTSLERSGDLARLRKFAATPGQRKTRQIASVPPPREIPGPPGRHYRRNIHRDNFDDVSRE